MNHKMTTLKTMTGLLLMGALCHAAAGEPEKTPLVSAPGEASGPMACVALAISPENSPETVAARDILTAHLFGAGIKVLSDEAIMRARDAVLRKAEAAAEQQDEPSSRPVQKKADGENAATDSSAKLKKPESAAIDGLAVVREAGADCLIKVTFIGQAVQQNVYDKENKRVIEVRTESRISLVTVSIVSTNGNILKAGSLAYPEPVSVATAAAELGKTLASQLAVKR